jgi:hypothetical protein
LKTLTDTVTTLAEILTDIVGQLHAENLKRQLPEETKKDSNSSKKARSENSQKSQQAAATSADRQRVDLKRGLHRSEKSAHSERTEQDSDSQSRGA